MWSRWPSYCRSCSSLRRSLSTPTTDRPMFDLAIALENRPGALAEMGEALDRAGVSIEGGGVWAAGAGGVGVGVAHFLFIDVAAARGALDAAGIKVLAQNE